LGVSLVFIFLVCIVISDSKTVGLEFQESSSVSGGEISFGVNSGSIFDIDPDSSIGVNVNFSSSLNTDMDVIVRIDSPSEWEISWDKGTSPEIGYGYTITPSQTIWIQFSVSSPPVIGGMPLALSLHEVSMSIVSDQGDVVDWCNFSLRYGYFEGVEIVQGGGLSSIVPGGTVTLETVVKNTGNSIRSLEIEIVPLGNDGDPLLEPSSFFSIDNWSALIIERWRIDDLAPNSTGVAMIQIFSPGDVDGALNLEIRIWSPASIEQISTIGHTVNIVPRVGGSISISEDECTSGDTIPGSYCKVDFILTNTGDSISLLDLEVLEIPNWASLSLDPSSVELQAGESSEVISLFCYVNEGTMSDLTGQIVIQLMIGNWSPGHISFEINSGPLFSWALNSTHLIDGINNLSVTWIMANEGNGIDGFTASIDSSVVTDFGISAPESFSSLIVSESDRALEIYPVSPNETVTITGWMLIPASAPSEMIANLSVEIRSIRDPSIIFIDFIPVTIEGELPPDGESDERESFRDLAIPVINAWFEPVMIVIVSILGIMGTRFAINKKRPGEIDSLPLEDGDWMIKFARTKKVTSEVIDSPEVRSGDFEKNFFGKGGRPIRNEEKILDREIVGNANVILDESKEESDLDEAIRIADFLEGRDMLHPDNVILDIGDEEAYSDGNDSENQDPSDFELEL